jgi:hypothetical protein
MGLLSALFGPRPKTLDQGMREQYARVAAAYAAAQVPEIDDIMTDTVAAVVNARGVGSFVQTLNNNGLVMAFARQLVAAAELYSPPPPATALEVGETSLEAGMKLRALFDRKERLLASYAAHDQIARQIIQGAVGKLLDVLPQRSSDAGEATFEVELLALLQNPPEFTTVLLKHFFNGPLEGLESLLFHDFRAKLLENGMAATPASAGVPLLFPSHHKERDPEALFDLYFRGTGLSGLMTARMPFGIPRSARFEHAHIVGGSGHGKTQCLQHLILQDLKRAGEGGFGFALIDSQGDLIEKLIRLREFAPGGALADRLILIDPNDVAHPAGLNLFDSQLERFSNFSAVEREKILNGTIELYAYIFSALLGAELTQKQGVVFTYLARAMLVLPNPTIHTLREFIEDGERFRPYIDRLEGTARHFFDTQFFTRTYEETRKQILTRLWGILANPVFERMFAHPKNNVDVFAAMQAGKILVVNTAKDLLKSEGASILGRFFIALVAQATLARSAIREEKRTPYHLYIDEAHDYFDVKIGELLNQARKYRLGITLAHQHLDQLDLSLRSTILTSTSVKLVGGVNSKDAALFAKEMRCDPEYIQSMRKSDRATQFACFVRHHTERPITLSVPFGEMESRERMSERDFEKLLELNRAKVAGQAGEGRAEEIHAGFNAATSGARPSPAKPKDDFDFYVS